MDNIYCVRTGAEVIYRGPDKDIASRIFDNHVRAGDNVYMFLDKIKPDLETC